MPIFGVECLCADCQKTGALQTLPHTPAVMHTRGAKQFRLGRTRTDRRSRPMALTLDWLLDQSSQALDRIIPLRGDLLQVTTHLGQAPCLQLPDAFASLAAAA